MTPLRPDRTRLGARLLAPFGLALAVACAATWTATAWPRHASADVAAATREAEEAIRAQDAERLKRAIAQLGAEDSRRAVRAILAIAQAGRDLSVHGALVDALARQRSDEAAGDLIKQMRTNSDWTVRYLIVDGLARLERPDAHEALFEAFSDKHVLVAAQAMTAAAGQKVVGAIPRLIERLEHTEKRPKGLERVQQAATKALEEITGERLPSAFEWSAWWKVNKDRFDPTKVTKGKERSDEHTVLRRIAERGEQDFLEKLGPGDIFCVTGGFDRVEDILAHLKLPHTVIQREDLAAELPKVPPHAVLIFNCDGKQKDLTPVEAEAVGKFVSLGGYLFTSDWELDTVVVRSLPGYLGVGNECAEHELPIKPGKRFADHPYLRDVFPENPYQLASFKWKIDEQSFAVKLGKRDVITLVECDELGQRYGSNAVAVTFRHGRGAVLHVMSHFQKQQDPKGDGYALQQLLVNFIVEKQKLRRK